MQAIDALPPEYRVRMAKLALQGYTFSFRTNGFVYDTWTAHHPTHCHAYGLTLLTLIDKLVFSLFEPAGSLPDAAKSAPAASPVTTN